MNTQPHSVVALPVKGGGAGNIGTILHEMGRLSSEDVDRVLLVQRESGLRFGEAAQGLGIITEADVRQVLARQFDYHYLPADDAAVPRELFSAYRTAGPEVETLRSIRTQLMHSWFTSSRKCLMLASVNPREGTSMFTANLAVMFSQLGQRTLLVDANLRTPRQHRIFNLDARQGLSDVLANRAGSETFFKVEAFPYLNVLPAGTQPPNPQELLSRPSLKELNQALAQRFDVILFDVPAFLHGADALTIASRVGGALLLCRKDQVNIRRLNAFSQQLVNSGAEIVGSVLLEP